MEAFAMYLLKSVIWLSGFALIFILFLRNERFFVLNRLYLVSGILISFFFPLISVHYTVVLPVVRNIQTGNTNQIVGSPVVSLANSFNYPLNSKRFKMMKNIVNSPYRKLKILLILPVFAIVLYSFAKPEYRYASVNDNQENKNPVPSSQKKEVKGTVVQQQDGKPLEGATVIVMGTTQGSSTDSKGFFRLENIFNDAKLVVSYVGFKSKVIKPVFTSDMIIKMIGDTVKYLDANISTPPPPSPPPSNNGSSSNVPLPPSSPPPPPVNNGEKGNYPPTSPNNQKTDKILYIVVEELPEFPGGREAMQTWISQNLKYPEDALKNKITGTVYVTFIVTKSGKVVLAMIKKSLNPLLDDEAVRVIGSMPDWKPGSQAGKAVDVQIMVPVEFKLQ